MSDKMEQTTNTNGKYVIGIDGGATKTTAVLADLNRNIIAEKSSGPANFLIIGTDKVAKTISDLILDVCNEAEVNIQNIEAICVGLTGAGRETDAEKIKNAIADYWQKAYSTNLKNLIVTSDARIALEGAFSGRPGIILIAGTGSIIFGKDRAGTLYRVGGFGRYIGDEGGGYSIGRLGLQAVAKSLDGRGPGTKLFSLLQEKYGINSAEDLINKVYKDNLDFADVAPLVIRCAEEGDEACREILRKEAEELVLHIKAIKDKIRVRTVYIAFIGGLLSAENYYSKLLRKIILQKVEGVNVILPEHPPAYGAVLLAMDAIESEIG
jgi:N-acetylglucosamine kinase-like BadF-type ATPase